MQLKLCERVHLGYENNKTLLAAVVSLTYRVQHTAAKKSRALMQIHTENE